jgi:hypothetical protein
VQKCVLQNVHDGNEIPSQVARDGVWVVEMDVGSSITKDIWSLNAVLSPLLPHGTNYQQRVARYVRVSLAYSNS